MPNATGKYNFLLTSFMVVSNLIVINGIYFLLVSLFPGIEVSDLHYQILLLFINFGYFLGLGTSKLLKDPRQLAWQQIVKRSAYFVALAMAVSMFCLFSTKTSREISRLFLILYFPITFIVMTIVCLIGRKVVTMVLKQNVKQEQAVILGAGKLGKELYEELLTDPYLGVNVLGFFDDNPNANHGQLIGNISQAKEYAINNEVNIIYCTLPISAKEHIKDIMDFSEDHVIKFHVVPTIRHYVDRAVILESVGNIPILSLRKIPLSKTYNALVKRALDIIVSFIFLTVCFPVIYLITGIAIKLSSHGPILFKQERTGKNGKKFMCYKFRSMRVNKEADMLQATAKDIRKTKVGDFLRRTNLDELPQFINVLKGDMSIVGPRPHMLSHTSKYSQIVEKYMVRHFIRPGITGLAQVSGYRGETKEIAQMEGRIKRDIWYLENWSLLLDIGIFLKTIWVTIVGDKKAY